MIKEIFLYPICFILYLAVPGTVVAAWLTHVISTAQSESWILLIAGAVMFPISIIHGIGIWVGVF